MRCMKMNIFVWVLPLLAVETVSLSGDLILRGNIYDTLNTLPLFLMLLFGAAFMYSRGFKYIGISVFLGFIIGILKMNYIFYLEDLSGKSAMNGAYALFTCLYKGVLAGLIVDAVYAVSRRLVQTGVLRRDQVNINNIIANCNLKTPSNYHQIQKSKGCLKSWGKDPKM